MIGVLREVEVRTAGTDVTANVAAGQSVVPVQTTRAFGDDGGLLLLPDESVAEYVDADPDALTITLRDPLAIALDEGDQIMALDAQQRISQAYKAILEAVEGDDQMTATIPSGLEAAFTEGTDQAGALLRITHDGSQWVVDSTPEQKIEYRSDSMSTPSIRMINNGTDQLLLPSTWTTLTNWSLLLSSGGVSYDPATGWFYNFVPGLWMIEGQIFIQDDMDGRRLFRPYLHTSLGDAEICRAIETTPGVTTQRDMLRFTAMFPLNADHAVSFDGWHNGTTAPTTLAFGLSGSPTALSYIQLTRLPG